MKKIIRDTLILLFPFLVMIITNEVTRLKSTEQPYHKHGITAINSAEYLPEKCTWACHDNTTYCKKHHVKFLKPLYAITDIFYFGVISLLASTGNYGAANIIFLVFLLPLVILFFIIKSIHIQDKICKLKKETL